MLGAFFADQTRAGWLDRGVDALLRASLAGYHEALNFLAALGNPVPHAVMTATLVLACLAVRRWRGALLVAVAVPVADASTEFLLKPLIHRTLGGQLSMPSGHATALFALATALAVLLVDPLRPRMPATLRLALAFAAWAVASAVALALVSLGAHYFTDAVAGAATGTGVVLATTLILDRFGWPRRGRFHPEAVPRARRPAAQRP
jgi:membrane-associated phospholipid phosphatase